MLKVLVLLLSIAGGSLVVWNATRDRGAANGDEIKPKEMIGSSKSRVTVDFIEFDSDDLVQSPKSGIFIEPPDISEIAEDQKTGIKVTDEEVKRTRDAMLSTSKSGIIMSDEKIREMLEEQKMQKPHLMHSSKVMIGPIIIQKDLEKMVEGEKQDPKDPGQLPPQEK